MVMEWFGYSLRFPGVEWVAPVLGAVVFVWGGDPFLRGGVEELRARRPGMMLLISMAVTVAFVASAATSLGWFDLDFWWELAALITIMLLGHWQEMKALGQAQGALAALAELLPDEAERIQPDGSPAVVPLHELRPGDLVLVRPGARVPADGTIAEGEADPRGVVSVIRLSKASYRKMTQNLAWAAGYNVVAIPMALEQALLHQERPTNRR
jgi:Cu2+-exporting ATPase